MTTAVKTSAENSANTSRTPLSKFEKTFRLWLAGFGVSQDDCDKLCANRRIALSIRLKDSGGIVTDLPDEVYRFKYPELNKAVANPGEMLFLMNALR